MDGRDEASLRERAGQGGWLALLAGGERAGDANLGETLIRLARQAAELDAAQARRGEGGR